MIRFQHLLRACALIAGLWAGTLAHAGNLIYFNELGGSGGSPRRLYSFDPTTGTSTLLSTLTVAERFFGMDRQPSTGILYAVEPLTSKLYKLNENTGAATLVGIVTEPGVGPINTVSSIAFDPTTGILYGTSQAGPFGLYSIDPNTASATYIGAVGQQRRALVCSSTGQLYCFLFTGRLYTVNNQTGAATAVGGGGGGITLVSDATFALNGKLYASDYDGSIHEIDTTTGLETPVGTTGLGNGCLGLAEVAGCGTTTYCTAKVNSLGCTPVIASTGTPSSTAPSGFSISCSQVRNQKSGLLFYGVNGPASTAFQGGTLCVKAAIKRTGAQSSGGTLPPANDCTGAWSIDMNTFAQSTGIPAPLPALKIPGTVVNCQWWGRDPGFPAPNNTQLSNGLQYTVCN